MPTLFFGAPYCELFSAKWGICQLPPIVPVKKFLVNFPPKIQIERGLFNERNCQFIYLVPHNARCFKQMGVSADRPKMDQFWILSTIYCTKSKFKEGVFYGKNLTSPVFRALWAWPFWFKASLPTGLIWAAQIFWPLWIQNTK